ncbi:hypothetical protein V6Z12_D09G130700 [Gossypium hirsutum]
MKGMRMKLECPLTMDIELPLELLHPGTIKPNHDNGFIVFSQLELVNLWKL